MSHPKTRWDCAFNEQSHEKYSSSKSPKIFKSESRRHYLHDEHKNMNKSNPFPLSVTNSKTAVTEYLHKNNFSSFKNPHSLAFSKISTMDNNKTDQQQESISLNQEAINSNTDNKKDIKTSGLETVILVESSRPKNFSEFQQTKIEIITPKETISGICKKNSQNVIEIQPSSCISSNNCDASSISNKSSFPNSSLLKEKYIAKYNNFIGKWKKRQKSKAKFKMNRKIFKRKNKLKSLIVKDIVPRETSSFQIPKTQKVHCDTILKSPFTNKKIARFHKQNKINYLNFFKRKLKLANRLNWKYYVSFIYSNITTSKKLISPASFKYVNKKLMQNPFLKHLLRHSSCSLNGDLKAMFCKIFKEYFSKFFIKENETQSLSVPADTDSRGFFNYGSTVAKSATAITDNSFDGSILQSMPCSLKKLASASNHSNSYQLKKDSFILFSDSLGVNEVMFSNIENERCFSALTNRLNFIWKDFLHFTSLEFYFDSEFFKKEHYIDLLRNKRISYQNLNCSTFLSQENGPIYCKNWLTDILFNFDRKNIFSLNIRREHPKISSFEVKHLSAGNINSISSFCYDMLSVKNKTYDHQHKMFDFINQEEIELGVSPDIRGLNSCTTDSVNSDIEETSEILDLQKNGHEQFIHSKYISSELPVSNNNIEEEDIESEECGYTKLLMKYSLQSPINADADKCQFYLISTFEILNDLKNDTHAISTVSEHQNNYQPNVRELKISSPSFDCLVNDEESCNSRYSDSNKMLISIVSGEKNTDLDLSSRTENSICNSDIMQNKDNPSSENYSGNEIIDIQVNDFRSKKLLSDIFISNCSLQKEKAVSSLQIDALFQDLDLFKQGGILFHYYQHLKEIGDHTLNLNEVNEDKTDLHEEVLESYNFLKEQLNYHKDLLRGLVHFSSEPATCFNAALIHDIVLQLEYIEGYELACKAILL